MWPAERGLTRSAVALGAAALLAVACFSASSEGARRNVPTSNPNAGSPCQPIASGSSTPLGTWTAVPPVPEEVNSVSAVTGCDGSVYVLGGTDANQQPVRAVFAYSPSTGAWSSVTTTPAAAKGFQTVARGLDGRIYERNCSGRWCWETASDEQFLYASCCGGVKRDQVHAVELTVEDAGDHVEDIGIGQIGVAGAGYRWRAGRALVASAQGPVAEGSQGRSWKARRRTSITF